MKHNYTVEELKELLYEAELDEGIKRAEDWNRIKKQSDKAWERANVASTPTERFNRYPPSHVRKALAIYDDEPPEYGAEVAYDFALLFLPMFIAMIILFAAGSM